MTQFARFIFSGAANTALGYGTIFVCMYLLGWSPELSNLIGYLLGLVVAYFLHRIYTFRSTQQRGPEFFYFVLVFLMAYTANLLALTLLIHVWFIHAGLSQVIAGVVYILVSFWLNRQYVFRSR